jgi:hypothetical protein
MLICVRDGVTTIKPGHQTAGNARAMWSYELSFTLFPTSGRVLSFENTQGGLQCGMPGSNSEKGGSSVMVWAAMSRYSILLVPLLPFMAELLQENIWTGWVIRCIPCSRRYLRTAMQFSKTTMRPFTQLELFSHGLKSMKVNFKIFPGQHIRQI